MASEVYGTDQDGNELLLPTDIFELVGVDTYDKPTYKDTSHYGASESPRRKACRIGSFVALLVGVVVAGGLLAYKLTHPANLSTETDGRLGCDADVILWDQYGATAGQLTVWCNATRDCVQQHADAVVATHGSPSHVRRERLRHYNRIYVLFYNVGIAGLLASVHPDPTMVTTTTQCKQMIEQFSGALDLDEAQYAAITELDAPEFETDDTLETRFLSMVYHSFVNSGINRDEAEQAELEMLAAELSQLEDSFARNIATSRLVLKIPADNSSMLAGLEREFVESHTNATTGTVDVSTDYPDYLPAMRTSASEWFRWKIYRNFNNRAYPDNADILVQVLQKRYAQAQLLNYTNYAEMSLASKMVHNATRVEQYLRSILQVVNVTSKSEMELLQAWSTLDVTKPFNYGYVMAKYRQETFAINNTEIEEYFTTLSTQGGVFEVAKRFFGVEMRLVSNVTTWHPDVQVFDVMSIATGKLIGQALFDLYPRDGKFKHAAMFPIKRGVIGIQQPVAALVCNFPKAPEQMSHSDVTTFFHEFGHLMHHVLAGQDQEWVSFSGLAMDFDFVEAPSQMLEKWPVATEVLNLFAFNDKGELIPPQLISNMDDGSKFGVSINTMQQIYYAYMSLKLHQLDPETLSPDTLYDEVVKIADEFSPFQYQDDTHMYASFGHLIGYGAKYYTYQWSLGIAHDMFESEFCPGKMMDAGVAAKYQESVLAPGGRMSAAQLVENFIGRPWNETAYTRYLRGTVKSTCARHFTNGHC